MRISPVAKKRLTAIGQWTLVALAAFAYVLAVTKPIILTASDLGRHLMNGKLFLDHGVILTTNEYSYTHPDFPFLNHHWGSGVLFELARRFRGFVGVSLFGLGLTLTTVVLYLRIAWLHGKLWLTLTAAAVALPMFASRSEVRPELFSYLLSGVFLWILLGITGWRHIAQGVDDPARAHARVGQPAYLLLPRYRLDRCIPHRRARPGPDRRPQPHAAPILRHCPHRHRVRVLRRHPAQSERLERGGLPRSSSSTTTRIT
jgi:hypothetical protein